MSGLVLTFVGLSLAASQTPADTRRPDAVYHDVDGRALDLAAPSGPAALLFFVSTTCPISNRYRPEIVRLCREGSARGAECVLVYTDRGVSDETVRQHRATFGGLSIPAVIDHGHRLVGRAGASVTPEAAIVTAGFAIQYRGRIDNRFEDIGRERRVVTRRDLAEAVADVLAGRPVAVPRTTAVGCFIE